MQLLTALCRMLARALSDGWGVTDGGRDTKYKSDINITAALEMYVNLPHINLS